MIWIAIIIEAIELNWLDFSVLMVLQILNGTVGFVEDMKAGDAVAALKNSLKPEAHVKRDGKWLVVGGDELVPGDRVTLHAGSNIPADVYVDGDEDAEDLNTIDVDQAGNKLKSKLPTN
jgi:H+-transporting ATPase